MLIRLALRNILRNRRRSAITLAVITFGVVGLILFGGYKAITFHNLRESTIRGRLGHLQVYHLGYTTTESQKPLEYGLDDVQALRAEIERDRRVRMTAAQIGLTGLISNGERSETFIATAVEPENERAMSGHRIVSGEQLPLDEADAVIIGRGLAASMNVSPGDFLTLMTTTVSGSLNAADVRVAGIFTSGVKELDARAIKIPLPAAQQLLQTSKVEKLLVFLHDTEDTAAVRSDLEKVFASNGWALETKTWIDLASFYHQVVLLYNGIFGFLGLVIFGVVIFSVANTILMSVLERTREIGTLMAIGTTRSRVARMFLLEGFLTGTVGGVIALLAAAIVAFVINSSDFTLPPPPGYSVGYQLRILLQPSILVTGFAIAVVTSTLSSIVPAMKAARLTIVDALGHI
ncbi:MAG TPA: FtsX-like permease family protein [Thermoanaerobaculia bacterium]|nr:FtsX-like permease family protein [Thermoanaerobaculia bacterium]